jgi:hypothetical protein
VGKINILCYFLGILLGTVALGIATTVAQDAWKSNEHVKGLIWSCVVAVFVVAAAFVGSLPMAIEADAEAKAKSNKTDAAATPTEASTERNFRLANQQWLETRNWMVRLQRRPEGHERLDIEFDLFNPSSMAVRVQRTAVDIMSVNPFVQIPMFDPAPQITSMVDTRTNEFIDTGIAPEPHHIRVPLDRNPDPRVERYSGNPKRPFQSKLNNAPPSGSDVGVGPPRRRGETKLGGHVLAPHGTDRLAGGWYDLDTPDKVAHYDSGRLRLSLNVTVEYVDAFDQPITRRFLMTAVMGRRSGHNFGPPSAIDHLPGSDVFGRPVKQEKKD